MPQESRLKKCSIIVSHYNQYEHLENIIAWFKTVQIYNYEMIIADDGSDYSIKKWILEKRFNRIENLKYITHQRKGFRLATVRNKGNKLSNGEVLIFLDSDMVPCTDFIEAHLEAQKQIGGGGGGIVIGYRIRNKAVGFPSDERHIQFVISKNLKEHKRPYEMCYGCNFSIPAKIFNEVNGFDEDYNGSWGLEDIDLAFRVYQKGYPFTVSTNAWAVHKEHHFDYTENFAKLIKKKKLFESKNVALQSLNPGARIFHSFKHAAKFMELLNKQQNKLPEFRINATRRIGKSNCTFVIAGINRFHNGDFDVAIKLIDVAKSAGADAVKFTICRNSENIDDFVLHTYMNEVGKTREDINRYIEFTENQYRYLIKYAHNLGMLVATSPLGKEDISFTKQLGFDFIRISHNRNHLLKYTGNMPVIASIAIDEHFPLLVNFFQKAMTKPNKTLAGILITSRHRPSLPDDFCLFNLILLREYMKVPIGISDHENGIIMAPVSVALGATIIEKHLTINHAFPGYGHGFALEPSGFNHCIRDIREVRPAFGSPNPEIIDLLYSKKIKV
ncbi:MAG: N-acetylneuraminate synthase family protein [Elusimicrobiota bacterium]